MSRNTENLSSEDQKIEDKEKGELKDNEALEMEKSAQKEGPDLKILINQIEALRQKVDVAEQGSKEAKDKALYAMAELENAKRRAQIDVEQAHKFGLEKCLSQLIPVLDSLDQALANMSPVDPGIELTLKMFIDVLSKFGVERLDPAGQKFDAESHEAMSLQQAPGVEPNTVIVVYQRGYRLNGRLVRPARVVVSE